MGVSSRKGDKRRVNVDRRKMGAGSRREKGGGI